MQLRDGFFGLDFLLKTLDVDFDLFGSLCKLQRRNSLIQKLLRSGTVDNDRRAKITSERVFEESREFGVPERNMIRFVPSGQSIDNIS